jgi:serine/threonine-protein kinase
MSSLPTRVGSFEVERELGRGGMGVVYLARDTRLGRQVALKALPEVFLADTERRARLEREAKALAAASHPNIAGIYGLETAGERLYLVLEYVAGETLARRLERGPLPVDEALDLAEQIAAGIEAAHEAGVVHRDLKPGNVAVTDDGRVKILDFGLATGAGASAISGSDPTLVDSPAGSFSGTREGVVFGTAAYMSPEQARGRKVDRRTDLWGFGCILYEMLTARRAFTGETVTDTLAAILRAEPDWAALPAETPEALHRLLRRCLEKDPRQRLRDAADARIELEEAKRTPAVSAAAEKGEPRPWRTPIVWAALAAVLVIGGLLGWLVGGRLVVPAVPALRHLALELPRGYVYSDWEIAPDGSFLVVKARKETPGQPPSKEALYVRRLDGAELIPVKGSEDAGLLGITPDGRWVALIAPHPQNPSRHLLEKVSADGSAPPAVVRDWDDAWEGGTFLPGGELLVRRSHGHVMGRVPFGTGPEQTFEVDLGGLASALYNARALPDASGVLVDAQTTVGRRFQFAVGLVNFGERKLRILVPDAGNAKLTPTGHLLFTHRDLLLMTPFDARRGALTGDPVAVADGLATFDVWANAAFGLANDGTLVYRPGGYQGNRRFLALLRTDGAATPLSDDRRSLQGGIAVSRDGRRLAVVVNSPDDRWELWTAELERPLLRRLLGEGSGDLWEPVFSPDGANLAYGRQCFDERDGLYVADWAGTSEPRLLLRAESAERYWQTSTWAPDGGGLIVGRSEPGRYSLQFLALDRAGAVAGAPRPLVPTTYQTCCARFSPDGKLVAYLSFESGEDQIVVAPWQPGGVFGPTVPLTAAKDVTSVPLWAPDGRGIYFVDRAHRLVLVPIEPAPLLATGAPRVLASWEDAGLFGLYSTVLTSLVTLPDGRFLAVCKGEEEREKRTRLEVVLGAAQAFAARLGQKGR